MGMLNFTAIDFETANCARSSVCSVGAVFVRGGEIEGAFYSLIRPTPNFYTLSRVHGLCRSDTDAAGAFPDVWAKISDKIGNFPLVAHFAAFDESCLRAVFDAYEMPYPNYNFYCTCQGARRYFSGLPECARPASAGLDKFCEYFGFELDHHHALSDASACAQIALKIKEYL